MNWSRWLGLALLTAGCSQSDERVQTLTVATTTSTRDSGLLDVLVPMFEKQSGIKLKVVAVGSGQALELGRRGDADVLLTHAPDAEQQFMAEGYGERHTPVMYNDFVLVGPRADPANVSQESSIAEAFQQISRQTAPFVSRADESGTHMKEKQIWKRAEIQPAGSWYIQAGAGMAEALRIASEKKAYALSDRSTFLAQRKRLDLITLSQDDTMLQNTYAVIVVSSRKHPHIYREAAHRFADFLVSRTAQAAISEFGIEQFGEALFFAAGEATK